jgi:hypothetical protein
MLSYSLWLRGLIVMVIVFFGCIFGFYLIYKSRKTKINILLYGGLFFIFYSLLFLVELLDFFTILLTNKNLENLFGLVGILGVMWYAPAIFCGIYIGSEFLIPNKKMYILSIYLVLVIICEILLFLDPTHSTVFIPPTIPGGSIVNNYPNMKSILGIFFVILYFSAMGFNGIGFLYKTIHSKKPLRKKFFLLTFGFTFLLPCFSLDIFSPHPEGPQSILMGNRLFILISLILIYFGLKPRKPPKALKPPKVKKLPSEEEIKLSSYMLGKPISAPIEELEISYSANLKDKLLIFVSYATKDADLFKIKDIAEILTKYEEIRDVLYWQEDLKDNIFKYMSDNLSKCDVMILFCSKNTLDSEPVEKEWTAADAMGKPIIPVFIKPNHIPPLLRSRLGLEFDFYDLQKNVQELHKLILKKFID